MKPYQAYRPGCSVVPYSADWQRFLRSLHKTGDGNKGNRTIAELRYGEIDIIIPSILIFAPIKS